jgi:hypothetical protein
MFTHLLDDGRICLSNNAAERSCAVQLLDYRCAAI